MPIIKSVFGGMKERCGKEFKDASGLQEAANRIANDAYKCIKNHGKEMTTIIRGLKHTTKNPDEKKLENRFSDLLVRWIFQLFRTDKEQCREIVSALTDPLGGVMYEAEDIITRIINEEDHHDVIM